MCLNTNITFISSLSLTYSVIESEILGNVDIVVTSVLEIDLRRLGSHNHIHIHNYKNELIIQSTPPLVHSRIVHKPPLVHNFRVTNIFYVVKAPNSELSEQCTIFSGRLREFLKKPLRFWGFCNFFLSVSRKFITRQGL